MNYNAAEQSSLLLRILYVFAICAHVTPLSECRRGNIVALPGMLVRSCRMVTQLTTLHMAPFPFLVGLPPVVLSVIIVIYTSKKGR
jgi:hypothetical protein